ncbi:MAG: DNA mismatch repair endonuclease MutL [Planctomycetes bacterium]|nr:DNA mismatch repair endonuclease MutL [Planctomycetota bacterium]
MPPLPPPIRQLPEAVANQIAAGEVLERPAAAVKELAENSLDAGATRIVVRLEDGGRRLVEVEDDGHGMRRDDLPLALARHATSKLTNADDLFRIATLGFRGEALPSIAAVSEFALASRPADQEQGWRLRLEGGVRVALEPCAMACGTRVSVRNLFWNVPARLKFLKTEAAEAGHVTDQVMRLALSHPRVAFRLETAGESGARTVIDLPAGETLDLRVRALFGRQFAERLLPVAAHVDTMQLAGFIAHPQEARPTAKRQYVFLNGRFVRDKLLLAAVREGFKGFLEPRLHGAVFLHLDLDPGLVDVNVHPTKSEVRFRREGEVFTLVRSALQQALGAGAGGFSLLGGVTGAGAGDIIARTVVRPAPQAAPPPAYQERFLPQIPVPDAPWQAPARTNEGIAGTRVGEAAAVYDSSPRAASQALGPRSTAEFTDALRTPHSALRTSPAVPAAPTAPDHLPGVRRVVQLNRMYLLIETDRGIRLVDQHALHEKALFLCLDPAATDLTAGGRQELLIPRTVELLAHEVAALEGLLPQLAPFGIIAEVFGPTAVLVRAHPAALRRLNWSAFLATLAEGGSSADAVAKLRERIAHGLACHGAVKAGQELSTAEQLELVSLLYRLEHMEHCPHGRPTTLDLPWAELERRFQR